MEHTGRQRPATDRGADGSLNKWTFLPAWVRRSKLTWGVMLAAQPCPALPSSAARHASGPVTALGEACCCCPSWAVRRSEECALPRGQPGLPGHPPLPGAQRWQHCLPGWLKQSTCALGEACWLLRGQPASWCPAVALTALTYVSLWPALPHCPSGRDPGQGLAPRVGQTVRVQGGLGLGPAR